MKKKGKPMKVYMIAEAQSIAQGSRNPCDDIFAYATAYPSHEAARDALREVMREVVNAAYEYCEEDEVPDVDDVLDGILDTENHDCWTWNGTDRSVVWNIVESEVNA